MPRLDRLIEKLGMFVSTDDLKGVNINHPAASCTDVPIGLPILMCWLDLIPIFVTRIETIAVRSITANTNPCILVSRFSSDTCGDDFSKVSFHIKNNITMLPVRKDTRPNS